MPSSRHARWLQETQRGQVVLERDGKWSKMSMPCRTNIIIFFLYYGKWRMDYRQAMGTGLFVPFGSRKKITSLNRCLAWSDKVNTLVNKFSNIVYPYSLARPSPSTPITLDRNQYYYCWLVWRNFERVQTLQVSQLYISPLSSSTKT